MSRVGVYGGSFSPPHNGHVRAALDFIIKGRLDELLICPVYKHPYGKELASFDDRMAMCYAAFRHLKNVRIDEIERALYKFYDKRGLTAELVESLAPGGRYSKYHADTIVLCVGDDVYSDMATWEGKERLEVLCAKGHLEILASSRAQENISSTMIRQLVKAGDLDKVSLLVDPINMARVEALYR